MYHGLRGIRYSHTVTHNANCTAFSKTLPLSECSTTKSHALGTKPESLWGSVSMHEMYGQPPPNPLLAAKKHPSLYMETTPTLRQLYGSGSLSHTKNKSMI